MNSASSTGNRGAATSAAEVGFVGTKGPNHGLKKGPWTAAEDAILMEYVKKHGEGNWNSVQKNSGLMRCGKSCRLRWANHLRPNLKKGSFTAEEERLIIHLHSKIGNKWARMASQLPGRTDNEIKNFWNTRMKRRQRAGLPLYPNEFQEVEAAFHLQQQQEQNKNPNSSSPNSLSSLLSTSHQKPSNFNTSPLSSLYDSNGLSCLRPPTMDSFQNHMSSSFYPNSNRPQFADGSLAMALYSRPPQPSVNFFDQNLGAQVMLAPAPAQPSPVQYDGELENNVSFTSLIMGGDGTIGLVPGLRSEVPPEQTPPPPTTPVSMASNVSGGGVCDVESSSKNTDETSAVLLPVMHDNGNSGLLDALLQESDNLSRKGKSNGYEKYSPVPAADKGKRVADDAMGEEEKEEEEVAKRVKLSLRNGSEVSGDKQCDNLSFSQSSIGYGGTNPGEEEPMEVMNSMDDDLLSLLNFPSSTPLPDWYKQSRNTSNGLSIGDSGRSNSQQEDPLTRPAATESANPNLECALGSFYWNNMPRICEELPRQNQQILQRDLN